MDRLKAGRNGMAKTIEEAHQADSQERVLTALGNISKMIEGQQRRISTLEESVRRLTPASRPIVVPPAPTSSAVQSRRLRIAD